VRVERLALDGDPAELVPRLRGLAPAAPEVEDGVREIIARVRAEGDAALIDLTKRFDTGGAEPPPLAVAPDELAEALAALDPDVVAALKLAADNVRAVAEAGVTAEREVPLPQGQRVLLREVPVSRAAVYVPGGRAPYPSTVIMGAVTARAAGVEEVAVCAPGSQPLILAACALCEVVEVYRVGGAQAIAALAYGTETIRPVDVVVGPGNRWVTEAKRQVFGTVGIDGLAGPSELVVVIDDPAAVDAVALDLLAQAEHGPDSLVVAISADAALLDALAARLAELTPPRPSVADAACALVTAHTVEAAFWLADDLAPEHLQLVGPGPEAMAGRVRRAGCVFVGAASGTAYGDYVAGSNHVLPTGGAARFASGLSARAFRRRMAEVRVGSAARALAGPGAAIARAEGFAVHAESMEARMGENRAPR
jgi:histidinol dehydrogenase